MFLVIFLILLFGLIFHEILSPIAAFLTQHPLIPFALIGVTLVVYAVYIAKKQKNILWGIGSLLSLSQFWFFVIAAAVSIADMIHHESDVVLSSLIALLVGGLSYAYACFNYTMLSNATEESLSHPSYLFIVGVVGWTINVLILF